MEGSWYETNVIGKMTASTTDVTDARLEAWKSMKNRNSFSCLSLPNLPVSHPILEPSLPGSKNQVVPLIMRQQEWSITNHRPIGAEFTEEMPNFHYGARLGFSILISTSSSKV